ncbi:MAG: transcriptional repressor [Holophagales bacterium]|nr:transcriptional repressor [Holophagales bacterium]
MAFPELDRFLEVLRENGHRVTPERLRLFREIYSHHSHIDADALLESMRQHGRKISRATLYRNLDLMARYGFVEKRRMGGNRFLYEHVHAGMRHDHLVCAECGKVVEFVSPAIEALQREICRAHGFDPEEHTLQIHSRCNECAGEE